VSKRGVSCLVEESHRGVRTKGNSELINLKTNDEGNRGKSAGLNTGTK